MAEDLIKPFLDEFMAKGKAALTTKVGRTAKYPGASVAWDDCCDGQLYVRVVQMDPVKQAGTRPVSGLGCGVIGWTATLAIGVLRCAATVDDRGRAPGTMQLNKETDLMTRDMSELMNMLLCNEWTWDIGSWFPLGPEGACVGGEWTFTVRTGTCDCG